jgi:hypothetical protein
MTLSHFYIKLALCSLFSDMTSHNSKREVFQEMLMNATVCEQLQESLIFLTQH